jgi:hypothetical protein
MNKEDYSSISFDTGISKILRIKESLNNGSLCIEEQKEASEFLFRKIPMMYKIDLDKLDQIPSHLKKLFPSIRDYRYAFMHYHFHYDPMMLDLASHFFYNGTFADFVSIILLSQFIIRYTMDDDKAISACDYILKMLDDTNLSIERKSNIVDVLIKCPYPKFRKIGNEILIKLRSQKKEYTIYEDSQNAHNDHLNAKALEILKQLNAGFLQLELQPSDDIDTAHKELQIIMEKYIIDYTKDCEIAESQHVAAPIDLSLFTEQSLYNVFERIKNDFSDMGNGETLHSIFKTVYLFITKCGKEEYKQPKLYRLLEELIIGVDWCTTNYALRMITSFQGFDDYDVAIFGDLQLTISSLDQMKSVIKNFLEKQITNDEACDSLLDDITNLGTEKGHKGKLICEFVVKVINEKDFKEYISGETLIDFNNNLIIPSITFFLNKQNLFEYKNSKLQVKIT